MRLFQWDRDFGVFFSTQGISNIGDAAWNVLVPLYVLQLTHNPLQVTAIAIIESVAFAVLRMPLGALADRLECRRLMIIADIGRTLLTLVIPLAAVAHADTLTVIYIIIVPIEAFSALFDAASSTAVPMLVTEDKRAVAYAWQESFESIAWVIGPPLGGLLAVAFGTGKALGLDSLSFLVSVAGLVAIRKRFEPEPDAEHEPMLASIRSGLRLMIADRVLRRDQLVWSLYSVLGGSIVLGLVYVSTSGGRRDATLATLAVAAYAAGSAAGTLLAARFEHAPSLWMAEAAGLGVAAVGAALLALGGVPAILVGGALFGLGEGLVLVFHLTLRARVTPDGYFGRITGVAGVIGQVTGGLSMVWLGLVLRFAPGRAAFVVLAAAAAALAAAIALVPRPPHPAASRDQDQDQDHENLDVERSLVPPHPPAPPAPGAGQKPA